MPSASAHASVNSSSIVVLRIRGSVQQWEAIDMCLMHIVKGFFELMASRAELAGPLTQPQQKIGSL